METEVLIRMPMFIEVQGNNALNLITYSAEAAEYQVDGFREPRLFLHDFRGEVNQVLGQMLSSGNLSGFANILCQPAETVIERTPDGDLCMQLHKTSTQVPELMCWIVVGIEGQFPEYPSLIQEVQPMSADRSAGLCIYPLEKEQMAAFIGLSVNADSDSLALPE